MTSKPNSLKTTAVGPRNKFVQRENNNSIMGYPSDFSTGFDFNREGGANPKYDALFLKRLLFLKASIDQDPTLINQPLPINLNTNQLDQTL